MHAPPRRLRTQRNCVFAVQAPNNDSMSVRSRLGFVVGLSVVPVLGAAAAVAERHFLKGRADVIAGFVLFSVGIAMAHFLGFLKSARKQL